MITHDATMNLNSSIFPVCFVVFSRQKTLKTLMFFQRQVSLCNIYISFPLTLQVPRMANINFLLTISIQCQEIRLWELIKWSPKRKCVDLLSNSLNLFFKEMYRDQFGEFVCGYWGLKVKSKCYKSDHFIPWVPEIFSQVWPGASSPKKINRA